MHTTSYVIPNCYLGYIDTRLVLNTMADKTCLRMLVQVCTTELI